MFLVLFLMCVMFFYLCCNQSNIPYEKFYNRNPYVIFLAFIYRM